MKRVLIALPLWGAFLICSCSNSKSEEPEIIVKRLYASVIYGKDKDTCVDLLSNYIYFNVFQGQLIKPTKDQAKTVCDGFIENAKKYSLYPMYGVRDFKVQVADTEPGKKIATVTIIMQDGRSQPAGNIKLFKKDNRWYMEY